MVFVNTGVKDGHSLSLPRIPGKRAVRACADQRNAVLQCGRNGYVLDNINNIGIGQQGLQRRSVSQQRHGGNQLETLYMQRGFIARCLREHIVEHQALQPVDCFPLWP